MNVFLISRLVYCRVWGLMRVELSSSLGWWAATWGAGSLSFCSPVIALHQHRWQRKSWPPWEAATPAEWKQALRSARGAALTLFPVLKATWWLWQPYRSPHRLGLFVWLLCWSLENYIQLLVCERWPLQRGKHNKVCECWSTTVLYALVVHMHFMWLGTF